MIDATSATIIAAVITAVGGVLATVANNSLKARQKPDRENRDVPFTGPPTLIDDAVDQIERRVSSGRYDVTIIVRVGTTYVDEVTDLVVSVAYLIRGEAHLRLTPPEKEWVRATVQHGSTFRFTSRGCDFILIILEIDSKDRSVKFRLREQS